MPMRVGDPVVGEYADVTARRSVTHLTFTNTFWRSVQTFLVLLRTEAGGMPAFQSTAASRRNLCGITRAGRPRSSPRRFAAIVGYADG
ncbi:MAG: hypothetical protein LBQ66_05035 [Planctomycetaceae bacterium]|nr:hypothetical protein [Planctomycetaceae bacterium]